MSAVAQATRGEVSAGQSVALMKNCVRAAVNEGCYLRNLFPSDLFREARYGTTTIRVLTPPPDGGGASALAAAAGGAGAGTNGSDAAVALMAQMEAAFEAVEKRYLRSIVFGVYSDEADPAARELLESYVFQFTYPTDTQGALRCVALFLCVSCRTHDHSTPPTSHHSHTHPTHTQWRPR